MPLWMVLALCVSLALPARGNSSTAIILAGERADSQAVVAALPNGLYQFCSKPEPQTWPLGLGLCFWFRKLNRQVIGYYGYPHSSHFIDCISGKVVRNTVTGTALEIPWFDELWEDIPTTPLIWDPEGFLILDKAQFLEKQGPDSEPMQVVRFGSAVLTLDGFYRYSRSKVRQMRPPPPSCTQDQL